MTKGDEPVKITYEGLSMKIFMDSVYTYLYGKVMYIAGDLSGDKNIFSQMLGNVNVDTADKFEKGIDIIMFTNSFLKDFKAGNNPKFVQILEDGFNKAKTPFRNLIFRSEDSILQQLHDRSYYRIKDDKKESENKKNNQEVRYFLKDSVLKDELMLSLYDKYKKSSIKESGSLFA